jgi:hypothetical protein
MVTLLDAFIFVRATKGKNTGLENYYRPREGKKMNFRKLSLVLLLAVVIMSPSEAAITEISIIEGASTAALITEDDSYYGWYLYSVELSWNLQGQGAGLSHWDMILKSGCEADDHIILFANPAGISLAGDEIISWQGTFELKDPSLKPKVFAPLIKYESRGEAGAWGSGIFYFISNIVPEYDGPYDDVLVAKAGQIPNVYGRLEGAYPSCTIIPEPVTLSLLGTGLLLVWRRGNKKIRICSQIIRIQ